MKRTDELELIAAASTLIAAALGVATTTDLVRDFDWRVNAGVARRRNRAVERLMGGISLVGEPGVHVPFALLAGLALARHAHRGGRGTVRPREQALALLPVAASLLAIASHHSVKHFYHRQRPRNPDLPPKHEYSYPSGHTTEVTALSTLLSYLCVREKMLTPRRAATIAVGLPAIVAFARVYRSRHWLTDVVGGAATGVGVSALAALAYELARGPQRARPVRLSGGVEARRARRVPTRSGTPARMAT